MIDYKSFTEGNFRAELHLCKNGVEYFTQYEIECERGIEPKLEAILAKYEFDHLIFRETLSDTEHCYYENGGLDCILEIYYWRQGVSSTYINILYTDSFDAEKLRKDLDELKIKKTESKENKVNFICQYNGGMELMEKELRGLDVHIEDYELSLPFEKVKEEVERDKAGLILFSGIPGSGKSSLIRHLISICNKKFVYIPVNVAQVLSDPSFINFAMENLSNSIIIIEDAETVLADRGKTHNPAASTILNLTDGLLGELLGIRVLATINVEDGVDAAILRKGRLSAKVTFEKLGYEKGKNLLKRLGKENKELNKNTKYSLAELYNIGDDNGHEEKEHKRIGF